MLVRLVGRDQPMETVRLDQEAHQVMLSGEKNGRAKGWLKKLETKGNSFEFAIR
jgi:hypothetical protein